MHDRLVIADCIETLAAELRGAVDYDPRPAPRDVDLLSLAKKAYSARRDLDAVFDLPGLSISPAWDILLDLYLAAGQSKTVSVSSACIGAACPPTTALRWLQALEKMALVRKMDDPNDGRRSFLELTDDAKCKIEAALRART
jgi:hypothetical protein